MGEEIAPLRNHLSQGLEKEKTQRTKVPNKSKKGLCRVSVSNKGQFF